MFYEPPRTPYDLNWRMFGIPVRVHPFFWIVTAVLGWGWMREGFAFLVAWIGCVFVSILVHELGHVFAGRLFGTESYIVLYGLGGLAIRSSSLRRWQRIVVSFAGPVAGFLLYGLVRLGASFLDVGELSPVAQGALFDLLFINLFWGLFNLLPIWPLDGGHISRDFLGWLLPVKGTTMAYGISFVVAGLLALNALAATASGQSLPVLDRIPELHSLRGFFPILFFGWLAFNSYQALQAEANPPWRRDHWKD